MMLAPDRFAFDPAQLAIALRAGGVALSPSSSLGLPPPAAGADLSSLADTGALDDAGALSPEAIAALQIVAAPVGAVVVVTNRAGRPDLRQTTLLRGDDPAGPWVLQALDGGRYDIALLPSLTQAVVMVDELTALSELLAVPGEDSVELSLAGFAALLAIADDLESRRLRNRLERTVGAAPTFSAKDLETVFATDLAATDTRWPVTAARATCPVDIDVARGHLADGLGQLEGVGLVVAGANGHELTATGYEAAASLALLVASSSVSVVARRGPGRGGVATVSILRTSEAIWVGLWSAGTGLDATVVWYRSDTAAALELVRRLLVTDVPVVEEAPPPPPPPAAPAGPAPEAASPAVAAPSPQPAPPPPPAPVPPPPAPAPQPVAEPVPEPAPQPAPSTPAWSATHRIGPQPAWAWTDPDPSASPADQLGAGLPVQVERREMGWARVVCSNGYTAWIDERTLVDL